MKRLTQWRWLIIALVIIIGFIVIIAPQRNPLTSGSTYNRAPDGYGAWYAYMQDQGHPIQRWQKSAEKISTLETPQTFLQVAPPDISVLARPSIQAWTLQGNTWILLEPRGFPTKAPFITTHQTDYGEVKLETTLRHTLSSDETQILGDQFGAIVWKEPLGEGAIIHTVSPLISANAYQDAPGNFAFLEALVTKDNNAIWIDETIHGYLDAEETQAEQSGSWISYLADTPLFPILVQSIIILLIAIGAQNRRFGPAQKIEPERLDNSQAYIQALAGVLEKAERSEFVLSVIGHETQLQLQQSLGLGSGHVDDEALLLAWTTQTGCSREELMSFLKTSQDSRLRRRELLDWIQQLKQIQESAQRTI